MTDDAGGKASADQLFRRRRWFAAGMVACVLLFGTTAILTRELGDVGGCVGGALGLTSVLVQLGPDGRRRLLRK